MTRLIPLILLLCQTVTAQVIPTLEPSFLRPGVFYAHAPVYGHMWAGTVKGYALNAKIGAGLAIPDRHPHGTTRATWLAGVNLQGFHQVRPGLELDRVHQVSIEMGIMLTSGRVTVMALTDPVNWESCFGLMVRPRVNCYPVRRERVRQVKCNEVKKYQKSLDK